jgi:carbon monoxide dehydrogenase subunit G
MAFEASHQVSIARTPEQVFAFVADGLNGPTWRPGILDIAHVSGTGQGTVYRQGVKGPGGRRIAADYRITAYEPPRRLAFEAIAGPVRPTGEYRFEPEGEGTRLTFSLHADLGLIQRLLLGRAVQATMEAEVRATERLKQHLETAPQG